MVCEAQMGCLVPRAQQGDQAYQDATVERERLEIQVVMVVVAGLGVLA